MNKSKLSVRRGSLTLVISAVVILAVIFLNLICGAVPAIYTKFSMTELYEVGEASKNILSSLEDEITVYTVVSHGKEDQMISEYLEKYKDYSDKITLKTVDPAIYPNFLSQYTDENVDASLTTIIVENKAKDLSKVIYYNDIFYDSYGLSYEEFIYAYRYYGDYFTSYFQSQLSIENKLTSGVDFVTSGISSVIYSVTGHGEASVGSTVRALIRDENFELSELALKTVTAVPENASALIIYSPKNDFEAAEISVLEKYIENGGRIIAFTDVTNGALPNFDEFTAKYGLTRDSGKLVCEGDPYHRGANDFGIYYSWLFPVMAENSYSSKLQNGTVRMVDSNPIMLASEAPEGVTLSALITTTSKGYLKSLDANTLEKEDGDSEGTFNIGAEAVISNGNKAGHLLLFTSSDIINGGTVQYYSNVPYFMAILTELCEKASSVTIGSQSLQIEPRTVSKARADMWGMILRGSRPIGILLYGVYG